MRNILNLANSFLVENTEVVSKELVKPFQDSPLHEMTTEELQAKLLEARSGQHWLKQFSDEEIAHRQFVHEATQILEFKIAHKKVTPTGNIKSVTTVADTPAEAFQKKLDKGRAKRDKEDSTRPSKKSVKESIIDRANSILEQAKWRQGYSASGHPAGYKHKNGDVGPVGGSYTNEPSGYDGETSKVPVQKYRDQPDQLADRGLAKISTTGKPLQQKNANKNLKAAIIQSKGKHGPVGNLPEAVEELDEGKKVSPYDRGYKDAERGVPTYKNPHPHGTDDHEDYKAGWEFVAGEIEDEPHKSPTHESTELDEGKFTVNAKTGVKLHPKTGAEIPASVRAVKQKNASQAVAKAKKTLNDANHVSY